MPRKRVRRVPRAEEVRRRVPLKRVRRSTPSWHACSGVPHKLYNLLAAEHVRAAREGRADACGADVSQPRYKAFSIIENALGGPIEKLESLLAAADYDVRVARNMWDERRTLAHAAASGGHAHALERLIRAKVDIHQCDRDGMSPAHHAAREGHGAVLRILVDAGANVDTTAALGNFTPVHDAARKGHIQALKVLVDAGADVNTPGGPHYYTPAGSAAFAGHTRVLEILRRAGADLDTADTKQGGTPIWFAAREGHADVVALLVRANVHVPCERDSLNCTCSVSKNKIEVLDSPARMCSYIESFYSEGRD